MGITILTARGKMMIDNTANQFGSVAKFFHWFMASLFIAMFAVAYTMMAASPSSTKGLLYGLHKSTGVLLFALVILRLTWRLVQPQPLLPRTMPIWQKIAAQLNFVVLYVLMFGMPLTGLTMSLRGDHPVSFYGLFTIPAFSPSKSMSTFCWQAHALLSYIMIGVVALHILAALYHHFIRRDKVLLSMLPGHRN